MPQLSTQEIMERIFPKWREYPKDSMTPSLTQFGTERVVAFLILSNEDYIKGITDDPNKNIDFRVSTDTEPSLGYEGMDIIIGLECMVNDPTGQILAFRV